MHSRPANRESGGKACKKIFGNASCAIFERGLVAGDRGVLRFGCGHDGGSSVESARGTACGGLPWRNQALRLSGSLRAIHLLHDQQLPARGAAVGSSYLVSESAFSRQCDGGVRYRKIWNLQQYRRRFAAPLFTQPITHTKRAWSTSAAGTCRSSIRD